MLQDNGANVIEHSEQSTISRKIYHELYMNCKNNTTNTIPLHGIQFNLISRKYTIKSGIANITTGINILAMKN